MSNNPYTYLCAQLQAALSDSPGGEKAWVPLRRSLVLACAEHLRNAAAIDVLDIRPRGKAGDECAEHLRNAAAIDDPLQWLQTYMAQSGIAAIEHNAGGRWDWTAHGIGGTIHTRHTLVEAVDAAAAEVARCRVKAGEK